MMRYTKQSAAVLISLIICLSCLTACSSGKAPSRETPLPETTVPVSSPADATMVPASEEPTDSTAPEASVPTTDPEPTPAPPASPEYADAAIMHELEFGGVYVDITIDDFNALGFAYGDSVTVSFSNGYELQDLPYYNGYYTVTGNPLVVAYPGYPYVKVCINNGDDLWKVAALDESMTVTLRLREAGKYAEIQDARDIHYKDDRSEFPSDAIFANFRAASGGLLNSSMLYRSASPCDNQHNRAPYVDALCKDAEIGFILNLADTDEKIKGYLAKDDFDSPYFLSLYESGNVLPIGLNMNYGSADFRTKLTAGLAVMAEHDGITLVLHLVAVALPRELVKLTERSFASIVYLVSVSVAYILWQFPSAALVDDVSGHPSTLTNLVVVVHMTVHVHTVHHDMQMWNAGFTIDV